MFRYITMLLVLVSMLMVFHPQQSFADNAETADLTKPSSFTLKCIPDKGQFTEAMINCIIKPIRNAVSNQNTGLMVATSNAMKVIVIAVLPLALVLIGIRAAAGESGFYPRIIALAIRASLIIFIVSQAPHYVDKVFVVFEGFIRVGTPSNFSPWIEIDKFLSKLIGFGDGPQSLKDGILGLLTGSFFAKNLGAMLTLVGLFTLFSILMFALQAMYLFLSSFITLCILLIILPFFAPFFVFTYTESYLLKWFDMFLSCMLTPMLVFAFLSVFLLSKPAVLATANTPAQAAIPAIIPEIVDEIIATLGPDYIKECLHTNQQISPSWLYGQDATQYNFIGCGLDLGAAAGCPDNKQINVLSRSSTQAFMNPTLSYNMDFSGVFRFSVFDCYNEAKNKKIRDGVFDSLLKLLFYTLLMNTGLKLIPEMSKSISGGLSAGSGEKSPLSNILSTLKKS